MGPEKVRIRAAFERFPATLKGAFLFRGADGLPHQVRIEGARAAECAGRGGQPIPLEPAILEVAPTQDTFVPFELPLMDLPAGWYQLECRVVIDGEPGSVRAGDRFAIPWPRSGVRRGTVAVKKDAGEVRLGTLECVSDSIKIGFESAREPHVKLSVDGASHPVLDIEHDPDSGKGRVIGYPVLRQHERLSIEVKGAPRVEVRLP